MPKMGSGDWNDGMSTVGNKGKGESVWLGFFLYDILNRFIPIMEECNRRDRTLGNTDPINLMNNEELIMNNEELQDNVEACLASARTKDK